MLKNILDKHQLKFIYSKPFQSLVVNGLKAVTMFALIKLLAVYGGPASLASFANFQNLIGFMLVLTTLSLQTGLTVATAKNTSSLDPLIICINILFLSTPFILLVVYTFIESLILANDILSPDNYFLFLMILILPFSANSLMVANEIGRQRYSNILINYVLVGIFPFITFFLLNNASLEKIIAGLCIGNWIGAIFLIWRIRVTPALFFSFKGNKKLIVSMLRYGAMSALNGILVAITAFSIRQYLSEDISLEVAGHWEALFKIGVLFQFAIAAPLISTGLPLMVTALKISLKDIISLLIGRIKTIFVITIFLIFISFLIADWIVLILFSEEFMPISKLIPLIIFSESLKAFGGIFILVPLANQQLSIVAITHMVFTLCILLGLYFLSNLSMISLSNITWLYLVASLCHAIFIFFWILAWYKKHPDNNLDIMA